MNIKKVGALVMTCIVVISFAGCSSKIKYPNKNINQNEITENIKNGKYDIYKVVQNGEKNNLKVTVTNPLKEKVALNFNTTQQYEFLLFKDGKEVYRYSKDRAFGEMMSTKIVEPKKSLEYNIDLSTLELEKGKYEYEFYLVAAELKTLPHKKGTLTIGEVKPNNSGIAYFPLKYEVKTQDKDRLIIEVNNQNEKPIKLTYTSGQEYDLKLYKEGKLVYTWSMDKVFIQAISEKVVIQGASEVYEVNLKELPLEKGIYEYEFYSTAKELSELPKLEGKINIS